VRTGRKLRGLDMDPDWYELPIFYFTNPAVVYAHEDEIPHPAASEALDYELEVAAVVGRDGSDLTPEQAAGIIAGYTIFNDFSARDVQMREMQQMLGPAKGKDFANAFGPVLVTPDALLGGEEGRPRGTMVARVNGVEYSRGELGECHWSFAEMIAYASRDSRVRRGDIIGSGTVGTGCILELSAVHGSDRYPWLRPGDAVELEVDGLGVLRNSIH
jgi:2-keto-4-pentenoate hydratase/2-oxohepta-3-ene-1,7-dioic acid hydratase in catechol pathway